MSYDTETLQAIIHEGRKQGFDNAFIADKLGICTEEVAAYAEGESTEPTNIRSLGSPMSGIGKGWHEWQFFGWPKYIKQAVLILISRIQEAAFRRGLQQGYLFATKGMKLKIHPDKMRWDTYSLDDARMCCDGTRFTSKQRLNCEHGHTLLMLGLLDSDDIQIH